MNRYRRLNEEQKEKLAKNKKTRSKVGNVVKWVSLISCMVLIFSVAVVAFYKFVDSNNDSSDISKDKVVEYENDNSEEALSVIDNGEKLEGDREDIKEEVKQEVKEEKESKVEKESKEESKERKNPKVPQDNTAANKGHNFSEWNKTCEKELIVVNGNNFIDEGFRVKTKVCRGKEISSIAADNLERMISDAKKEGILLWISSGYRSVELQTKLFNRQVEREKAKGLSEEEAKKKASTVVAKPGTSEHNTGLAVDFNGVEDDFYKTKEYKWLMENAHKYGFIERYTKQWQPITGVIYEPWHFRYVGEYHAQKIKESGMCLEEYVCKVLKG